MEARAMLGDILLRMGSVQPDQLQAALGHHFLSGVPLGRTLVEQRACSEGAVMKALSVQVGLHTIELDPKLCALVPARVARQHRAIPVRVEPGPRGLLYVAVSAPGSLEALDAVRAVSGRPRIQASLATDEAIARALVRLYGLDVEQSVPRASPSPSAPAVLLYGFPHVSAARLTAFFIARGLEARVARALEVMGSKPSDVVFAPLGAIEELLPSGARVQGQLLVQGHHPESDFERAAQVGARGFLGSPLDDELLLRAMRRLRPVS